MDTPLVPTTQNTPPSAIPTRPVVDPDVSQNKDLAALSYVWVLSAVVYFSHRTSPFARFHAKQGLVLFLLCVGVWFIPVVGTFLELPILVFCVMGFIGAAQGQWKRLPIIYAISSGDWHGMTDDCKHMMQSAVNLWKALRQRSGKNVQKPAESIQAVSATTSPSTPPSEQP